MYMYVKFSTLYLQLYMCTCVHVHVTSYMYIVCQIFQYISSLTIRLYKCTCTCVHCNLPSLIFLDLSQLFLVFPNSNVVHMISLSDDKILMILFSLKESLVQKDIHIPHEVQPTCTCTCM